MNKDTPLKALSWNDLSARDLAKTIFRADLPEQFVRSLPAQSLYLTILYNGLSSSADLMEIVSNEQCQLLLDFDLWRKDNFDEDRIWDWLALTDEHDGLELLQKITRNLDLKIVAIMMARHLEVRMPEQPTETPFEEGFFTPDKGYTWLRITIEDQNKSFLFGRLLALIYETNADLFYQLLSIPSTNTNTVLEEQAFNDKNRHLSAEGIPDPEYAAELHRSLSELELQDLLKVEQPKHIPAIAAVLPLVVDEMRLEPLSSLVDSLDDTTQIQLELTLLMNAALIRFSIDLCEYEAIRFICGQVRGAINVGLSEALKAAASADSKLIYAKLGLTNLYRLGLTNILPLRKLSANFAPEKSNDPSASLIFEALSKPFPATLAILGSSAMEDPEFSTSPAPILSVSSQLKPIESLADIRKIQRLCRAQ